MAPHGLPGLDLGKLLVYWPMHLSSWSHEGPKNNEATKTYNTKDSLVVTDPTTDLALTGLSMGERTGSRVLQWVWSYVLVTGWYRAHEACDKVS